jgi:hypothetical protein
MKDFDAKIRKQKEHDQVQVQEEDKSLFLLPVDVQIKCHNLNQKGPWQESEDLAYNAWHRTSQGCRSLMELGSALLNCGKHTKAGVRGLGKNRRDCGRASHKAQVQFLVCLKVL